MENESPLAVYPLVGETGANSAFGPPAAGAPEPPPAPAAAPPPREKQGLKTWLAGGVAAAVFGIGGFFGIQAVTNHSHAATAATGPGAGGFPGGGGGGPGFPGGGAGGPGGPGGTITAINGSTLTLSTRDGSTLVVTTSPSTTVTDAASGTVSDIKAGDHIVVRGASASGGITATRITDTGGVAAGSDQVGPPGGANAVTGTVASVGNGTFTVTGTTGAAVTVTTSSSTNVTVVLPSSVSALSVGDSVRVTGTTTNNSVAATSIQSGTAGFGSGGGPSGGFGGGPGGPPGS